MSRHALSRVDRVAQMSIQEEIIARKKLEILEKQRTAELAKQVVAAQSRQSAAAAVTSKNAKKDKVSATTSANPTYVHPPATQYT